MAQKQLFEIEPWTLRTTKLDKENKRLQESLTSLGNGYMGMRGNLKKDIPATAILELIMQACGFQIKQELAGGKMATQIISVKSLTALTLSELKYVLMVKNSIYL